MSGRGRRAVLSAVFVEIVTRPFHQLEREPVGALVGLTPRDQAVVVQDDRTRIGEIGHAAGQLEARPDVRRHGDVVSKDFGNDTPALGLVREGADGIGMNVVDVRRGEKRVQQRLDRGPSFGRVDHAAGEVVDQLFVAHLRARAERQQLVEIQACEPVGVDGGEIRTGCLDPQHRALAAEVVALCQLGRRVAAAVDDELRIAAQQPRARDEALECSSAFDLR